MSGLSFMLRRQAEALDVRDDGHTVALLYSAAQEIERLTEKLNLTVHDRDQAIALANDWLDRARRWRITAEHLARERETA